MSVSGGVLFRVFFCLGALFLGGWGAETVPLLQAVARKWLVSADTVPLLQALARKKAGFG